MTMPTFRKADDVPPSDTPPRRGPGRPKGSGTGRRRSTRSLRSGIDGLLVTLNTVLQIARPADALDATELAVLGKAIDEQAKTSPRFRRGLEAILNVTGGTALAPVLILIASRRLARHGVIPTAVDPLAKVVMQMMQAEPSEAAAAMESIMGAMEGIRGSNGDHATTDTPES